MLKWIRNTSASFAIKWVMGTIGGYILAATIVRQIWEDILNTPTTVLVLLCAIASILILAPLVVFAHWFLFRIPKHRHTPRYLIWYRWPIHRISWNLDGYLGLTSRDRHVTIDCLQISFKINRGKPIRPLLTFIECESTGYKQEVLVECGNPYVSANTIASMPKGKWHQCRSGFAKEGIGDHPEGMTPEVFLSKFDGFRFVFEYEGGRFEKRFSRSELETILDAWRRKSNPRPEPRSVALPS